MKMKLMTVQPAGVVRYVFDVDQTVVQRISETQEKLKEKLKPYSSYFGTVTNNGVIQIWGVGIFCRSILTLSTTHDNCSWTAVTMNEKDNLVQFLVYARGQGLFIHEVTNCTAEGTLASTTALFHVSVSPGFSCPVFHANEKYIKFIDKDDNLVQIHIFSNTFQVFKLPNITHITFFTAFNQHLDLVLVGSESGKVSLIGLSFETGSATTLDEVDLLNNDIVANCKRKCILPSEENLAIPLCCTGNQLNGDFLIGTRANVLVQLTLDVTQDTKTVRISKCKGIPNPGVHSILLFPDGDKILVHGWDTKVRMFNFPSMEFIQAFEWTIHSSISAMSFLTKEASISTFPYLVVASETPVAMTLRLLDSLDSGQLVLLR